MQQRCKQVFPVFSAWPVQSGYKENVVGGDEKGSLKSETVKYGLETQEGLHWQGPVAYTKDRPVLSPERALHKNRAVIVKH
jgi:hypothetical protein